MTPNDLKTLIQTNTKNLLTHEVSLYQRSLSSESTAWIREVESTAKRVKKGKVVLVAILID